MITSIKISGNMAEITILDKWYDGRFCTMTVFKPVAKLNENEKNFLNS